MAASDLPADQPQAGEPFVYTPEMLAKFNDGQLAAHLYDTIMDIGEDNDHFVALQGEISRRELSHEHLSKAHAAWLEECRSG